MAQSMQMDGGRRGNPMRLLVWGTAACLLLLPLVAMQFTAEVDWDGRDFLLIGGMLLIACVCYELGVWISDNLAYRAGFGMAVITAFLLVWVNLAVGMIGDEGDAVNLWFGGVLIIGLVGAGLARFQPRGMARTLVLMTLAQAAIALTALIAGWDERGAILSGCFALLWLAAAAMFKVSSDTSLTPAVQKLKVLAIVALLIGVLGILLVSMMIVYEGEPGLIPLVMTVTGAIGLAVARWRLQRA